MVAVPMAQQTSLRNTLLEMKKSWKKFYIPFFAKHPGLLLNSEFLRDPCQWGNPLKMKEFREPNEYLSEPYSESPCLNSPYPTLLNHHRER
ncbi:MAG TPA: hypothetical protein V6D43_24220, partial [Candidatus Sericytochromatia bacterium]